MKKLELKSETFFTLLAYSFLKIQISYKNRIKFMQTLNVFTVNNGIKNLKISLSN